ncbi:hypothetical protein BP6252_04625 [Coleophoma cylindrospora]|uniref:O-fucosyltransferase family protein n=1 Tax=Coleophoma cylindrospora TaxID=1849047 RepID=A0A3D8S109_9HELO|nr:hypothetical protein BP6252_04625 [Coleophoma cylindrospora]
MGITPRTPPFKLAIVVVFFVSIVYFFSFRSDDAYQQRLVSIYTSTGSPYASAVKGKQATFVKNFFETEIDGPINLEPIKLVCDSKSWNTSIIVQCELPHGGVASVRNTFLNCVRYAIEIGGAFMLPQVVNRDWTPKHMVPEIANDMSYFFDTDHFVDSMTNACPQMRIYHSMNELWNVPTTQKAYEVHPEALTKDFAPPGVLKKPEAWRDLFLAWLQGTVKFTPTDEKPILVKLKQPFLQFPLRYDRGEFVVSFGRILRFREDARFIAANVLYALGEHFNIDLDPTKSIRPLKFYGAHLRNENDAATPIKEQINSIVKVATEMSLRNLYFSSMVSENTTAFATKAMSQNISLACKESLLAAPGYEPIRLELAKLTWDQQAVVDYEVFLRSSFFSGAKESAFAWNIAMRRHIANGEGTWMTGEAMKPKGGPLSFLDKLSMILGTETDWGRVLETLWP